MSRLHRGLAATAVFALGAAALIATPLAAQGAESGIRINEVESSKGEPGDWIEFFNPTTAAIDLTGYRVQDDSDKNPYTFPAGTIVEPGAFLVIDELSGDTGDFDFGLGGDDKVRLFDPSGALADQTTWPAHSATTWGARDGENGIEWAETATATKGAENTFADAGADAAILINEVDSQPADWVEFYNPGTAALDISGYEIRDNSDDHRWQFLPGTSIQPGEFLVVDEASIGLVDGVETAFRDPIGIGSADRIRLFDATGAQIDDTLGWDGHAAIDGDFIAATLARCVDGEGSFQLAFATPGAANECVPEKKVVINEVESDGGSPDDWIELANPTADPVDVSGLVVKDDDDAHEYVIAQGTSIPASGYLVITRAELDFGLGKDDKVRLFDGETLIDETSWGIGHVAVTWGRCPDITGDFAVTGETTPGAANICADDVAAAAWPGSPDVRVLDAEATFLEDSSGLDAQQTAEGTFLWGIDNGEGRLWKMRAEADGSVAQIEGWEQGKRIRYAKDADDAGAAGPDTEGVTVDGAGFVYAAAERDNSVKGANENVVLKVDPEQSADDLVAVQQWDLTEILPAVGANLGIEAIEWVRDAELAGILFDDNTAAAYEPADYAGHGDGLFFVAMEENGHVYAFALAADGSATQVAEIAPGLSGVMGLDYDSALGVLWAVCDDGCQGRSAQITLNGTAEPEIVQYERPAGLPDINNEGFATAPASLSIDGQRPVWWFADGYKTEALRVGTLPGGTETDGPDGPDTENPDNTDGPDGPETDGPENPENPDTDAPETENPDANGDDDLATTGAELPLGLALGGILAIALGVLVLRRRTA